MVLEQEETDPMKLQVLVIGCEPTFLNNVTEFLHLLNHEVWIYKNPTVAFNILRMRRNFYDLIITDLYLGQMDGFEVQKTNRDEFKLPLIIVSSDDRDHVILNALKLGAAHYIVKPISFDDVRDLWQFVPNKFPKKHPFLEEAENGSTDIANEGRNVGDNGTLIVQRRRTMKELVPPKKAKMIWTHELHARFLEAINSIGLERAVPRVIVEVMNVDGLTRENVASHLQKYRQYLRRLATKIAQSKTTYGGQSSTSIFRLQPIEQNIYMNHLNPSPPSLGYPLFNSNEYQSSSSSSSSSSFPSSTPLENTHLVQLPQATLSSFMGPSSQNGSGVVVQATNNAQRNNGVQSQTSSSLANNFFGDDFNNPSMSHLGFPYNNTFINNNEFSWSMNDSSRGLIINDNYYDGLPMITSPASLDLAGFNSTTTTSNPSLVVENVINNGQASSAFGILEASDFGSIVLNNNTDDQNVINQDMLFNASSEGNLVLSNNNMSSSVELDGSASLVGFFDGFTTNGEAMASNSNVVNLAPANPNQTWDNFDDLQDILFNNLEPVVNNQKAGNEVVAPYETSASLATENVSLAAEVTEPNGQNTNTEVLVLEEAEYDWLDLLDASTVVENVTVDEDFQNFMDSMFNGSA